MHIPAGRYRWSPAKSCVRWAQTTRRGFAPGRPSWRCKSQNRRWYDQVCRSGHAACRAGRWRANWHCSPTRQTAAAMRHPWPDDQRSGGCHRRRSAGPARAHRPASRSVQTIRSSRWCGPALDRSHRAESGEIRGAAARKAGPAALFRANRATGQAGRRSKLRTIPAAAAAAAPGRSASYAGFRDGKRRRASRLHSRLAHIAPIIQRKMRMLEHANRQIWRNDFPTTNHIG